MTPTQKKILIFFYKNYQLIDITHSSSGVMMSLLLVLATFARSKMDNTCSSGGGSRRAVVRGWDSWSLSAIKDAEHQGYTT